MNDEPDLSLAARRRVLCRRLLSRQDMIVGVNLLMRPSDRARFARFLLRARREVGLKKEITVFFADNDEMRRLNRQFRHKNHPTDVLSFPSETQNAGPQIAGDIAISVDVARENAAKLGHSFESELKILILHGVLHLAGYDHERDNGEMAALENRLRAKLKLPLGLIERNLRTDEGSAGRARSTARRSVGRGRAILPQNSNVRRRGRL